MSYCPWGCKNGWLEQEEMWCPAIKEPDHPREEKTSTSDIFGIGLSAMPYDQYLRTPHWQRKRKHALVRAEYRCEVCKAQQGLHVHHLTYERRGAEWADDLTVLCGRCHEAVHDLLPEPPRLTGSQMRQLQHLKERAAAELKEAK